MAQIPDLGMLKAAQSSAPAAPASSVPPREEWPTFQPREDRDPTLRGQMAGESDQTYLERQYMAAVYWAQEDAKSPQGQDAQRRAKNAERQRRFQANRRAQAQAAATPEQKAAIAELEQVDRYIESTTAEYNRLQGLLMIAKARKLILLAELKKR